MPIQITVALRIVTLFDDTTVENLIHFILAFMLKL
jgi:hypothetical protein